MASQMGSETDLGGRPYDLAMSKSTGKPSKLDETLIRGFALKQGSEAFLDREKGIAEEELVHDGRGLKQLFISEGNPLRLNLVRRVGHH